MSAARVHAEPPQLHAMRRLCKAHAGLCWSELSGPLVAAEGTLGSSACRCPRPLAPARHT